MRNLLLVGPMDEQLRRSLRKTPGSEYRKLVVAAKVIIQAYRGEVGTGPPEPSATAAKVWKVLC